MPTVLIVDDDENLRLFLCECLGEKGYSCCLAGNAAEARQVLGAKKVELILSDIHMPGESGLDFLEWALSGHPGTAALVMTGNAVSREVRERISRMGAYCCMAKPISLERLLTNLEGALLLARRPQ